MIHVIDGFPLGGNQCCNYYSLCPENDRFQVFLHIIIICNHKIALCKLYPRNGVQSSMNDIICFMKTGKYLLTASYSKLYSVRYASKHIKEKHSNL